jgi:putative phosphoesterase
MLIGVISDTHGRLDPAVAEVFAGVDHIVHAGDVGDEAIVERLREIAPITAVRGNCDDAPWGLALPCTASEPFDGVRVTAVHDLDMLEVLAPPELRLVMRDAGAVVISGHTHFAETVSEDGVLYLNPGSASLCWYERPRSVALLRLQSGQPEVQFVELGSDLLL